MQKIVTRSIRVFRNRAILASLLMALASAMSCSGAWAQSGAGSIQGTVADPTGAVVRGASIHVVNNATGVAADTTSNSVGFYQVPNLFTGIYTITISAPATKTYQTSVELLVAQTAVISPRLVLGEVTQQVIVNADSVPLVTTDDGAITSTLENSRISQLPENGRDLTNLMNLTTPGLEDGTRLNGLAPAALEYVVDGVATKNDNLGGESSPKAQLIDPDAVQEVRLEANGSGAEYATPGTVIVSTKSGTNRLHGTLFETSRNNVIGVAKSRQDPPNSVAPKYDRNEFGASIGGPIVIPHIYNGKSKSFFFFAYERFSLVNDVAGNTTVPTLAMRHGDFSGLIGANGVLQTIYDPSTTKASAACAASPNVKGASVANPYCRTPFPNNTIPVSEESPTAAIYYQLVPLPAGPNANANPLVLSNLNYIQKQYQVVQQMTFRLDHGFTENNKAYLRFSDINSPTNTNPSGPYNNPVSGIPAGAALGYANNPAQSFLAGAGYTHIFSPTFFAETIVSQQWLQSTNFSGVNPNVNYEAMLNLPNNFGEVGFPGIGTTSLIQNLQSSQTTNTYLSQIVSTIDENLTKTMGKHQLHFGGRYRHERLASSPVGAADNITFNNNATGVYQPSSGALEKPVTGSGYADASFFLGSAASYGVNLVQRHFHYHVMEFDTYLQDDFHVSQNLTLNLGLRYEAHPAIWTKFGVNNTFDIQNHAMVLASTPAQLIASGYTTQAIITNDENIGVKFETPQQAGLPSKLMYDYNLNFLPRLGFAWRPFDGMKTVIHGAYGIYDYPTILELYVNHPESNNPLQVGYTQSYLVANQAIDGLPNEQLRYNSPSQFGIMGLNTANVVNSNSVNSILPGVGLFVDSPNYAPDRVTEANATIEQPLKGNAALRISWIFTHGSNLEVTNRFNNSPSDYVYEMAHGVVPPTGGASVVGTPQQNTYAATALGPYDQTTYKQINYHRKIGWSNDNALQINYQRLYNHGSAYQISATYSKAMRMGGDALSIVGPAADYPGVEGAVSTMTSPYGIVGPSLAPPPRPAGLPDWADYKDMDRYEQYSLDQNTPVLHIKGNAVYDLPIGRGQRFLGNVNRLWNEILGGYQIAATGNVVSQVFQPPSVNLGPASPIKLYKHKAPITDCRSGVCQKSYLWYNGYLPPTVLTPGEGGVCATNCVSGIPGNYVPYLTPINNTPPPATGPATGAAAYFGDNDVVVTLANGTQNTIAYDSGPYGAAPTSNTWTNGPINWTIDASIFKVFPITEKVKLRVNVDAFNALNMQGYSNPGAAGVENLLSSANIPRQIQLTARLTF